MQVPYQSKDGFTIMMYHRCHMRHNGERKARNHRIEEEVL